MYEFGAQLSSIELIPWESGTFDVSVDGSLVHSMKRDGGFPKQATVKSAVRARLGSPPAV
jgi:selenoprotein W-related protein